MTTKQPILIIALLMVGLATVVAMIVYWIGQPATARVITPNSPESRVQQTNLAPPSTKPLTTSCFTLSLLPELSIPKTEEQPDGCVLRAALSQPNGQVTVTLQRITNINLEQALSEHTGILLRETQTQTYQPFQPTHEDPVGALIFHKAFATPTEMTGFFTTQKADAIVTVTIHSVARVNPEVKDHFWRIVAAVKID